MERFFFYVERLIRCFIFILGTALFTIPVFASVLISPSLSYRISRFWFAFIFGTFGIELKVRGKPPASAPFVVASNHRSFLDIPAISLAIPYDIRFVAKSLLLKIPFIGWGIKVQGHPIVANGVATVRETVAECKKILENGISLVIFPEGTRGAPGSPLLPFKDGVFYIPKKFNVPLLPVAVAGSDKIMPRGAWVPRSGIIEVRIGQFCTPEEIRNKIEELLCS